ncbi:zinc-ribbon domain-containing protein [Candidatus Contubernalis alkalaceticus]|uniref:zinc-ribbon domain-containing protein n=1 Tax=Candidatus Contubernalis alkaliaceticus TaxID=338645 RepID=UPI00387ECB4B|nr:zinc-ribbon domain-containing protein [Candidatus Contubernalis alkalaceticus]
MILLGIGEKIETLGKAGFYKCPNCHNECLFNIVEIKKRLGLFFIPVLSWDKKYFLSCTICKYGYQLKQEELKDYKFIQNI